MSSAPIGIFDSGIGGLTVARTIHELLPNESTIYLGDTARVPYGPKSPETVQRYSREIVDWLSREGVKAVVVACNTATAHALPALRERLAMPVVGVIEPGARAAALTTARGTVGVIGTAGTISSGAYRRALELELPGARIVERACPLFVPLVEEGWLSHPATRAVAEEYLADVRAAGVDVLVLGCTHYPLLKPLIGDVMGCGTVLIDSAYETARELVGVLQHHGIAASPDAVVTHRYVVTDDIERFERVGAVFLGKPLTGVEHVNVEAVVINAP
ncbi:MAG: glutamate racemase [Gemmatimonadales bacterium]